MLRHRPFLILNSLCVLWLGLGTISVRFRWNWAGDTSLVGTWLGLLIAAMWVAAANVALGMALLHRRYMRGHLGGSHG